MGAGNNLDVYCIHGTCSWDLSWSVWAYQLINSIGISFLVKKDALLKVTAETSGGSTRVSVVKHRHV